MDTAKAVLNDPIGVTANVVTGTAAEAWKWVSNPEKAWDELVAEAEADGQRIQHMIDTEDWNGIAKGVGNSIVSGITDKGIGKVVKLKSGSGGKGNSGKNEKSSNKGTPNADFDVASFEKTIAKMNVNEKVAKIRTTAADIAKQKNWKKDSKLTKQNGRDVYFDSETRNYYALDTQHGRFEMVNKKGKHQGEVDFNLNPTKPADKSGGHDLKVK